MKLYYAPGTISIAVAIALNEAGLTYDTRRIDFQTDEQSGPVYGTINPKRRVPALDVDGTILTETGAILEYVAARAPGLMPDNALLAARARAVMYYLASTMHVNHAHKGRGHRWADCQSSCNDMTAKVPQTMADCAAFVQDHCLGDPYVLGQTFSLADPYLFVVCTWLPGDGVDIALFPKLRAFMQAMETRASVQAVRANGMLP